ncbi:dTDP-4-dehydrorhamnose 3,5-epimerase [Roseivirga pacifica]|jgi:dTDP-4-dehydrorhamnose 3,5-epimerase|uniref:dTDP-4-dehydrorhamnose 3,5-epimerase n=1 Tax=Roseivirga pacifica TaxID=1267423 RepID=UPI003BAC955A
MTIRDTPLKDAYIIEPKVFSDDRGYFFESHNQEKTKNTILESYNWVQENESKSTKGVLRGLHFQKGNYSQAKLVRVILGKVFDVAVDLRKDSPSFGKWHGVILSEENKHQFLVPRGFAHGFLVLSDVAVFSYKCDNFYAPEHDSGIRYDDIELNINWPLDEKLFLLSQKDSELDNFKNSHKF